LVTHDVNSALSDFVMPNICLIIVSFQDTTGVLLSVRISAFNAYLELRVRLNKNA
jgi:hypothetical protein